MSSSRQIKLAPSILSADFTRLGEQVMEAEKAGADYIHVDVMDGVFVPNITIGNTVVAALRRVTKLPLDVHLMIEKPENHIEQFAGSGADIITVHIEASSNISRTISRIKELGVKAGVSLNPGTSLELIRDILPVVDLVLVMSVNPGWGGQQFIAESLDKIARLREIMNRVNPTAELEVDGGINASVAPQVVRAGANVLVAGSAIFNRRQSVKEAIEELRNAVAKL